MTQACLFDETTPALPPIPVNVSVHLAEAPRLSRQCRLILERLRSGAATNTELAQIALKYTSRLSDLRAAGYTVTIVQRDYASGSVVYRLCE